MTRLLLFSLLVTVALAGKIGQIPGYSGPEISQYTGYITLDQSTQNNRFYWLVESLGNPKTDPLVFWFQGGPGCSGLIGLFSENGPYRMNQSGPEYNTISWVSMANIVYLEQPTGVGFSYSNSPNDYITNDTQAALDNFKFVELWLQEFPQYQGRPTFFTGESYGGVYVPTLTSVVLDNPSSQIASQLRGFSVGNPVFSCQTANYNAIQFDLFYFHGLVSYLVYSNWTANECQDMPYTNYPICQEIFNTAQSQIGVIFQQKRDVMDTNQPSLDPDDLYQDFCTGNGTLEFAVNQGYPNACYPLGVDLTNYLNREDVQQFIGAKSATWGECAGAPFNYTTLGQSMIPHYKSFFDEASLSILVYSGDVDIYTVPFGYTQACLAELEDTPVQLWSPWFVNGATAGYFEMYEHYAFATIKGAGHEAPQYQPLTSLELFRRYIAMSLNESPFYNGEPRYQSYVRRTQGRILKDLNIH